MNNVLTPILLSIPAGILTSIIGNIVCHKFIYKTNEGEKPQEPNLSHRKILIVINILSTIYVLFVYYFSFKRWVVQNIYLFFFILFFIYFAAFFNAIFIYLISSKYSKWSFSIIVTALLIFLFADMSLPHYIKINKPEKSVGNFILSGLISESDFYVYVIVHPFKVDTWFEQPRPTIYKRNWQNRIHLAGGSGDDFEIIALASKKPLDICNIIRERKIPGHIPRHILAVKKEEKRPRVRRRIMNSLCNVKWWSNPRSIPLL